MPAPFSHGVELPYNRRMVRSQQLILNRYRPIEEAGSGGFGTVQIAWDTRIQRKVAIKCIELDETDVARAALPGANAVSDAGATAPVWDEDRGFVTGDSEEFDAFGEEAGDEPFVRSLAHLPGLDEARTAAMLSDASIVAVYDFEVQGSTAYLIMECVEGITLGQLLRRYDEQLSLDIVAAVFAAVSHALEVAHDNQVLHLDIKPDNVLINRQGQVKVTDFGLATLADASGFGVAGGGTIGYMPPEQMRQESLDARCDEWALASVVYEMLAGENPFLAPDFERAEAAIEEAELVLPSLCWDGLDAAVDDVIFYALDPDREERYDNVADFAEELEPFLGDPKRGVRELAAIVGCAQMDDDEDEVAYEEPRPRVPLRDRITRRQLAVAAHAVGALGSALVAFTAFANLPQVSGWDNPVFWGLLALVALAGALKPHLGALLAFCALSAAFIAQDAPAAGCVLLAATCAWWYFAGRDGNGAANAGLAPALAGAVGGGQLAPLVAGFCLRPARALGTAAYCVLVGTLLAALGSSSLLGWDMRAFWDFGGRVDVQVALWSMLVQPAYWCVAVSWLAAAPALALCRLRRTRASAVLGTCLAGALLLGGVCAAAWLSTGQRSWAPSAIALACTLVPIVVMLVAGALAPDPLEEDEAEFDFEA